MNKKQIILNDVTINMIVGLSVAQAAQLHRCSRAYVSKLCSQAGITINRRTRVITLPAATLKQILFYEVQQ